MQRRDWPGSQRAQDPGRRLDHKGPYSGEFGAPVTAWDCSPPEISTRSCHRPRQSAERQAPILPRRRESTISSGNGGASPASEVAVDADASFA